MLTSVEEFLTGERPTHAPDRALRTLLFTDIVDSTATAARLGDREWHELLDQHDTAVEAPDHRPQREADQDHRRRRIREL